MGISLDFSFLNSIIDFLSSFGIDGSWLYFLLLLPAWGWGATYTVGPSGCDQTTIQAALNAYTTSGDIIEVHGGAYAEKIASVAAGVTLRGRAGDTVIIDGTAINDHTVLLTHAMSLQNFTIKGYTGGAANVYGLRLQALCPSIQDVIIDGGQRGIYDNSSNNLASVTVKDTANSTCIFTSSSNTTFTDFTYQANAGQIYLATTGNLTFIRPNFIDNTNTTVMSTMEGGTMSFYSGRYINNASPLGFNGTGTNLVYNMLFAGNERGAIKTVSGTPTVNVVNDEFIGNCWNGNASYYVINKVVGTINVSYSLALPNPLDPTYLFNGVTDGGHNLYELPRYRTARRPAIVVFGTDDAGALDTYAPMIGTKLQTYGWRGTYAVNIGTTSGTAMTAERWTSATVLVSAGHEIASHGYYCASDVTDMNGLTVYYDGAEATARVSIASDTMTLEAPNGSVVGTFDLTDAAYDTLDELVTAIGLVSGFHAVKTNGDSGKGWSQYLDDATTVDVKVASPGPAFDYSSTKVYAGEVTASKASIEAHISGYACNSFVAPGNNSDASLKAAALSAGYTGARGGGSADYYMSSINVYGIMTRGLYSLYGNDADPTDTTVKKKLGAVLEWLKHTGGILVLYAHDTSELTADGWDKTLAVTQQSGVSVMTLANAVAYAKTYDPSGDLATADSMTYTRTMVNAADYRLRPSSPAINAGTDVGLTTDYLGKPVRGTPDIGAYEFQPMVGNFGFGFRFGF